MEKVVKRGVRVRVLTNSMRSNNHLAAQRRLSGVFCEVFLVRGVEIFETRADAQKPRSLHASTFQAEETGATCKIYDY